MAEVKGNLPYHIWRFSNNLYRMNVPLLPFIVQQFLRFGFCCMVPYKTRIGKDVHFSHMGMGIVIHPLSVIGDRVKIFQHVTIGGRNDTGLPIIGDDVEIGANAVVLGGVKVGKNAKIGANAVVLHDVPEGCTAVGNPARVLVPKKG